MTGINQKVFSRAFGCHWDCENRQRIDGDMAKWSLWQKTLPTFVLNSLLNNMSLDSTSVRPKDDVYNIQHRCLMSQISTRDPCSTSLFPMDDSPLSEIDYAVRVASENNIEMLTLDSLTSSSNNAQSFNFSLPLSYSPRVINKATVRGHLHFHPWTAWRHFGATLACFTSNT